MARQLAIRNGAVETIERLSAGTERVKTLDFSAERVQSISLDTLNRTYLENDRNGKPLFGAYHKDLIGNAMVLADKAGYKPEIYDLFAADGGPSSLPGVITVRELEQKFGEKAVEATTLRRVYANVHLPQFNDGETTMNMAISFHQQGIEIGFGPNVVICHNQTMLGASDKIQTFGRNQTPIEEVYSKMEYWFHNAEKICKQRRACIALMKQQAVDATLVMQTLGLLTATMVKHNSKEKEISAGGEFPLTNKQLNMYTEQLLLRSKRASDEGRDMLSMWDLYDAATELYQPSITDMPRVLNQNLSMVGFLDSVFPEIATAKSKILEMEL